MAYRHPDRAQIRLDGVLSALGNPVRLGAVAVLDGGGKHNCTSVLEALGVTAKSTMTHHWRVLRDCGVMWQWPSGRENLLSLRREDLDARYPGLLDAVLAGVRLDQGGAAARLTGDYGRGVSTASSSASPGAASAQLPAQDSTAMEEVLRGQ